MLGLLTSNHNKTLWGEDVYEWKPERWLTPLPRAVEEARIPGAYSNFDFKFSQSEESKHPNLHVVALAGPYYTNRDTSSGASPILLRLLQSSLH
ncbi:hypothetical protein A0H81_12306 [Grifola frondosa]|uniref:Uncharacterized protein n=1 Tax=Grifola frondosa TaxID=5627 RepID=A0A1C7LU88_GRIFR|nr:hypothetical protein A0H81_12306 [Grifola frondosa]